MLSFSKEQGVVAHEALCDGSSLICDEKDCSFEIALSEEKCDRKMRKHKKSIHGVQIERSRISHNTNK